MIINLNFIIVLSEFYHMFVNASYTCTNDFVKDCEDMDNGVKKVRKAIERRKRMRGLKATKQQGRLNYPSFPQEEEKHGYYPYFSENYSTEKPVRGKVISGYILKGMLSIILFFSVAILHESNAEVLLKPKEWTSNALSEEFPFAKVHSWYRETFGSPLAFSPGKVETISKANNQLALPVSGSITETFQSNGKGIMITPGEAAEVSAIQDGVIIFAGNDRNTQKTVIVQHADGTTSTYGYLSNIDVHLYQYVSHNQKVGEFMPSVNNETVYFSIEHNNKYIDPVQVIQVDETS